MYGRVGVCLSAVVKGEVFIIKLSGDKRVLGCVLMSLCFMALIGRLCVCPESRWRERSAPGWGGAPLTATIIPTALATKH